MVIEDLFGYVIEDFLGFSGYVIEDFFDGLRYFVCFLGKE